VQPKYLEIISFEMGKSSRNANVANSPSLPSQGKSQSMSQNKGKEKASVDSQTTPNRSIKEKCDTENPSAFSAGTEIDKMVNEVRCKHCEYLFEVKRVGLEGKTDEEIRGFICTICKLECRIIALEVRLSKLEISGSEIEVLKAGLQEARSVQNCVEKSQGKIEVSAKVKVNNDTVVMSKAEDRRKNVIVVGDSLVGTSSFCLDERQMKVDRNCLPGAGIDEVHMKLKELVGAKDKKELQGSFVVLHVGGNDIDKYKGRSEELVKKLRDNILFLRENRCKVILSGIIPRLRHGAAWTSFALSLNSRMKSFCDTNGCSFVDSWSMFWQQQHLYKDNIHITAEGDIALAGLWTTAIIEQISKTWKYIDPTECL
jgi:hypothetical protein